MREVVIVDSVRTGLAKSFRGKFNMTRPDDMAALRERPPCAQRPGPGAGGRLRRRRRLQRRRPGPQHRPQRGRAVRPGHRRRRHDPEPLLLLGPPGHRHRRQPDRLRLQRRDGRRRRRVHHPDAEKHQPGQLRQPAPEAGTPRHLLPDGADRRDRRAPLQRQPRGAGPVRPAEPAAHRPRPGRRPVRRRDRADEREVRGRGQGHRREEDPRGRGRPRRLQPRRHHPGRPGFAEAGVLRGRFGHRRQLLAAVRRRLRPC